MTRWPIVSQQEFFSGLVKSALLLWSYSMFNPKACILIRPFEIHFSSEVQSRYFPNYMAMIIQRVASYIFPHWGFPPMSPASFHGFRRAPTAVSGTDCQIYTASVREYPHNIWPYIWVNYNNPLTWKFQPVGDDLPIKNIIYGFRSIREVVIKFAQLYVGIAIINHQFLMVYTSHLWWSGGWFIIAIPTLLIYLSLRSGGWFISAIPTLLTYLNLRSGGWFISAIPTLLTYLNLRSGGFCS